MKLDIKITSGERSGRIISLPEIDVLSKPTQWIKENESIELMISLPNTFIDAELILYDHKVEVNDVEYEKELCQFKWIPKRRWGGGYECLFLNYFGLAELSVKLLNQNNEISFIDFQPIEVLASKANADNVDSMLSYLSNLNDDELHSLFQTTKYNAGFKDGHNTPISNLERLEYIFGLLTTLIPDILRNPISKLLPEQKVIQPNDHHDFNDESLGWLMSNLSVLEECDDIHQSHLRYGNRMYRASALQVSELKESTDVYENQVINGFVQMLVIEASNQLASYENIDTGFNEQSPQSKGYVSFFDQINKFKKKLLSDQIIRCESLLNSITSLKFYLEKHLQVSRALTQRPMLTNKAATNLSYRTIFIEFINWFEKSKPDWSTYENLFAIKSIPILFESYCYYQVAEILNIIFGSDDKTNCYWEDKDGNEYTLLREPKYWMPDNRNITDDKYINTQGNTITKSGIKPRSRTARFSHRCPDIVIEVKLSNDKYCLLVLDAKYTTEKLALNRYLPECTMKYANSIHYKNSGENVVNSMTILFPLQQTNFISYHVDEHNLFSNNPISPSLQCFGLELENKPNEHLNIVLRQLIKNTLSNQQKNSQLVTYDANLKKKISS